MTLLIVFMSCEVKSFLFFTIKPGCLPGAVPCFKADKRFYQRFGTYSEKLGPTIANSKHGTALIEAPCLSYSA